MGWSANGRAGREGARNRRRLSLWPCTMRPDRETLTGVASGGVMAFMLARCSAGSPGPRRLETERGNEEPWYARTVAQRRLLGSDAAHDTEDRKV